MATKITNQQHLRLLEWLGNFGVAPAKPRTDTIAKELGLTTNTMPHIGLELRAFGWVQSTNDGKQYNYWQITAQGRSRLLEHRAAVRKEAQVAARERDTLCSLTPPSCNSTKISEWLVVGPEGEVSVKQHNHKDAGKLAEKWAKEEPGKPYKVVAVLETYQAKVVIDKV